MKLRALLTLALTCWVLGFGLALFGCAHVHTRRSYCCQAGREPGTCAWWTVEPCAHPVQRGWQAAE